MYAFASIPPICRSRSYGPDGPDALGDRPLRHAITDVLFRIGREGLANVFVSFRDPIGSMEIHVMGQMAPQTNTELLLNFAP